MQAKNALLIFLIILAGGFGVGLIVINNKARDERHNDVSHITQLSNEVVQVRGQLDDQKNVNLTLENNLGEIRTNFNRLKDEAQTVSNKLTSAEALLASTAANLQKTQAEVTKRDAKIAELEGQNDELTKKMLDLNINLGNLEKQITDTEQKLAASEGDREFLLKELKRLQAEKAELERQFNDLAVLREQVRKLKEELSISRRLDWIRRGIYGSQGQKGAERLTAGSASKTESGSDADLKVELKQDGAAKIESGTKSDTNGNAPPPK